MDSDFLLIQRMKLGDEQAIDLFVRKYYPVIFQYCRLHVKDFGYTEDMTQETFTHFFRTFKQYQHYGKALNYLYVIAANACRDHHKKREEIIMEVLPQQPDTSMETLAEQMDIHLALDNLPEELQEVAILFFFQEIRQSEISKILGIGLPLVKYRVRKAKQLLTVQLRKDRSL